MLMLLSWRLAAGVYSKRSVEVVLEGRVFRNDRQGHARRRDVSDTGNQDEAVHEAGDGLDVERRRHGGRVPARIGET